MFQSGRRQNYRQLSNLSFLIVLMATLGVNISSEGRSKFLCFLAGGGIGQQIVTKSTHANILVISKIQKFILMGKINIFRNCPVTFRKSSV